MFHDCNSLLFLPETETPLTNDSPVQGAQQQNGGQACVQAKYIINMNCHYEKWFELNA